MTTLARSEQPRDDIDDLRSRIADLESALDGRCAEIDQAKASLSTFKTRYRHAVGALHDELDELERAIAELELGEISKRLEAEGAQPAGAAAAPRESAPRLTSDAVRRLFRDVARTIHPDLARDELARDRRHRLMIEANRAYALGDEERLRWILQAWERSPDTAHGDDRDATRRRLERRAAQLEEEIELCTRELASLRESPTWKLKAMVDAAAARGTDLVADMVRRLKRDVLVARNRLDAMRAHR